MAVQKRKTLGLLSIMFSSDYMLQIMKGVKDFCRQADANLLVYSGRQINFPWNNEYQQNIIYEFVSKNDCDALIVPSASLYNFIHDEERIQYSRKFAEIPMVSIGVKMPGIPSVLIDNKIGLREELEHFIHGHHYRRIGFIKGPEDNPDAQERLEVYLQVLKENSIEVNPDFIFPGDFTPDCGNNTVQLILDGRKLKLDALIGANDDCIIEAGRVLQARGISVPQGIALGGFDNTESSVICVPPLTTVEQPLYEMGKIVSQIALDMAIGKEVPEVTILPTRLVQRSSCGCIPSLVSMTNYQYKSDPAEIVEDGESLQFQSKEVVLRALCKLTLIESEKNRLVFELVEQLERLKRVLLINEPLEKRSENFIREFYAILLQNIRNKDELLYWQLIITELFELVLQMKGVNPIWQILLNNCRVLLADLNQQEAKEDKSNLINSLTFYRDSMARLISAFSINELLTQLYVELPRLGFNTVFIAFYQKQFLHKFREEWPLPEKAKVMLALDGKDRLKFTNSEKNYSIRKTIFPASLLPQERRWTLGITPVHLGEVHYGLLIMDIEGREGVLLESFIIQINSIIHDCFMFDSKQKTEKKLITVLSDLKEAHQKLSEISETDELTGLYNRRGFLNLAQQNLDLALRMKKSGLVFFADMDGLKKINDTYGHKEGDLAIMETAEILREIFRNSDIIARLGGDEFTVLAIDTPTNFLSVLQSRLHEALKKHNTALKKPYQISISIGAVAFGEGKSHSLEKLMIDADQLLYEKKRNKLS